MKRRLCLVVLLITSLYSCVRKDNTGIDRPKLVVGIVVDQMRWDYLYRYANRYGNGGFKRLMREGFNCQQTMLPYVPSVTAPGHACIYTGSVPSIHGIVGNNWVDNVTCESCYCVDDATVHLVGDDGNEPSMSPKNLLTTTITDELRLATNQQSRVYGIAIKDRGAILPAGHLANAAYFYNDKNGNFNTSTYYPNRNPAWLQVFNKRKMADSLAKLNWKLLYGIEKYDQSTVDATNYEKGFKGEKAPVFPHIIDTLPEADRISQIKIMPQGNTLTLEMARACIDGEHLGHGGDADFLAVSLSSTDYAGHQFGPNSVEMEDMFIRLDQEMASFLDYLDSKVGRGNYLLFLTADHGAAHNTTFLSDIDVPSGNITGSLLTDLNSFLKSTYGQDTIISNSQNYQLYLNEQLITSATLDREKIKSSIREWMGKRPEIAYAIDMEEMDKTPLPEPIRTMAINGYNKLRSGQIWFIPNPAWYEYGKTGTTHGTWQPYDSHIPLLWYGWHIPQGETNQTTYMTDISATLAALLHIQMPNGCIGHVIPELFTTKSPR